MALLALLGVAISGGQDFAFGLFLAMLGFALWLAGHWHFAFRYHAYKSPLAQRIFVQLLPRRMDPTRNWVVPMSDRDRR